MRLTLFQRKPRGHSGFSLAEVVIATGIIGIITVMSLRILLDAPQRETEWANRVSDYAIRLSSAYREYKLTTGHPPINTSNTDGLAAVLPDNESGSTHSSTSPEYLDYPGGFRVYLKPEQLAASVTGISATILTDTDNREWLLIDMNPDTAPSNLATDDDLVLLRVNNTTGSIQSAYQVDSTTFPTVTFYDN